MTQKAKTYFQNTLLFFLFGAFTLTAYSQTKVIRGKGEPADLYRLNLQARKYVSFNPDSVYLLTAQVLQAADSIRMPYTIVECRVTQGLAKMAEGKWTEAEDFFQNTLYTFRNLGDSLGVAKSLDLLGYSLLNQGLIDQHFECQTQALSLRLQFNEDPNMIARSYSAIGTIYYRMGDSDQAMEHYKKTLEIRKSIPGLKAQYYGFTLRSIGNVLNRAKKYDEALVYYKMALDSFKVSHNNQFILQAYNLLGDCYLEKGDLAEAEEHLNEALKVATQMKSIGSRGYINLSLAKLYQLQSDYHKALQVLESAEKLFRQSNTKPGVRTVYKMMATIYDKLENQPKALQYFKAFTAINDTLTTIESTRKLAELDIQYKIKPKEEQIKLLKEKQQQDLTIRFLLLFALVLAIATAFFVFRANSRRKKAYVALIEEKKKTDQLYQDLQIAQSQLVQSEKMASLGQLTAGIAHEINNPINYINSSAEALQLDLIDIQSFLTAFLQLEKEEEYSPEITRLIEQAQEMDVPFLLTETGELINGVKEGVQRVAEIVKGLKIFTYQSSGEFIQEDLGILLESTLVILKNKINEKEVKVIKKIQSLPKIFCQPGKINQVFANVIDNAIEAMDRGGLLEISASVKKDKVIMQFKDNGRGMDNKTIQRIFDPFFTTKDVGKGTGLGMAISYGIIKEHSGDISIHSSPGNGTKVELTLPIGPV